MMVNDKVYCRLTPTKCGKYCPGINEPDCLQGVSVGFRWTIMQKIGHCDRFFSFIDRKPQALFKVSERLKLFGKRLT